MKTKDRMKIYRKGIGDKKRMDKDRETKQNSKRVGKWREEMISYNNAESYFFSWFCILLCLLIKLLTQNFQTACVIKSLTICYIGE